MATAEKCQCLWRGLSRCYCQARGELEGPPESGAGGGPSAEQPAPCSGEGEVQKASAQEEPDPLRRARSEALEGRDTVRGKEPLVSLWREVSKPRKGGAIPSQPPGCKVDFDALFFDWMEARGLAGILNREEDQEGWAVFSYRPPEPVVESRPNWEQAFHGTWWYAVWLILKSGVLLESNNRSLGHDFWEPGVYCSPSLDTGLWYARPQILFGDGVYHRVIFELRVDPEQRKRDRKRGGVQWVFPSSAVAVHAIWVRTNAPPKNGEERVNGWDPELEALPPGCTALQSIVNPRKLAENPWPDMEDEFPFDKGNNDAPPWMQTSPSVAPGTQPPLRGALRPALVGAGGAIRPLIERARARPALGDGPAERPQATVRPGGSWWRKGARPPGPPGCPWSDGEEGAIAQEGLSWEDSSWWDDSAEGEAFGWDDALAWDGASAWDGDATWSDGSAWSGASPWGSCAAKGGPSCKGDKGAKGGMGDAWAMGGKGGDFSQGGKGGTWANGDAFASNGKGKPWANGGADDTFASNGKGEPWAKGGKGEALSNGGKGGAWANGCKDHTFASCGQGNPFVQGSQCDNWAKGGTEDYWAAGRKGGAFAKGGTGDAWANGGKADIFVEGGKGDTFAKRDTGSAWAKGGKADTFAKGGKGDAWADGGKAWAKGGTTSWGWEEPAEDGGFAAESGASAWGWAELAEDWSACDAAGQWGQAGEAQACEWAPAPRSQPRGRRWHGPIRPLGAAKRPRPEEEEGVALQEAKKRAFFVPAKGPEDAGLLSSWC